MIHYIHEQNVLELLHINVSCVVLRIICLDWKQHICIFAMLHAAMRVVP